MTNRTDFLRLLTASGIVAGAPSAANAAPSLEPRTIGDPETRTNGALVLSGGGATGAYQAGAIAALADKAGIRDGEALPGIDAVVGTSIGSINAWFVATAQYSLLAALWRAIANEDLFVLKKRFQPAGEPSSGVLTRLYAALSLGTGLLSNVQGVFDRGHIERFVARIVDADRMPLVPFVFTATNLSEQRAEIFFRTPVSPSTAARDRGEAAMREVVGGDTRVHEATPAILHRAIVASAAIPLFFDPVVFDFGSLPSQYVDGGIADNSPVDVARVIAKNVYTLLVDPATPPHQTYKNAAEIGSASLGVAQRRILDKALRSASLETEGARLFSDFVPTPAQRAFRRRIFAADLFVIQPSASLPVAFADFTDQRRIDETFARGYADGTTGWQRYRRNAPSA